MSDDCLGDHIGSWRISLRDETLNGMLHLLHILVSQGQRLHQDIILLTHALVGLFHLLTSRGLSLPSLETWAWLTKKCYRCNRHRNWIRLIYVGIPSPAWSLMSAGCMVDAAIRHLWHMCDGLIDVFQVLLVSGFIFWNRDFRGGMLNPF